MDLILNIYKGRRQSYPCALTGGVGVQCHTFLTSALNGDELSASCPGHFTPQERAPGTHWMGPRASPDAVVKRNEVMKTYIYTICCSECNSRTVHFI
jgi:hypothetical protein